ncbi:MULTISPECIES: KAP family P-loop NTPase fold protein [Hyphomonas]|uniref:KAP NTPase domain-containing protein n=1 Tax=Hyphomonas adhaerens TaxID=81029 RepID=A0A3B9H2U4_9PROT|nr:MULTISPECIES: P-loop NTPase fold protein [Hyphomonas]MBB38855.1 hypothetical protein [Hyphomonas sp.]HAE29022.1 hypothetical protein [Hyphomonas adhaerens]|tara:strand:- start:3247 stop:5493 length:2247 start_codon:yes stop_codon:yes gene_type:complete
MQHSDRPQESPKRSPHAPITNATEDAFGFGDAANFVASAIMNREDTEAWIIGIDGVWGEGKSSLVNLVELELLAKQAPWRKPILIRFEPWLSGDTKVLVGNFFRLLVDAFNDVNQAQYNLASRNRWEIIWLKIRLNGTLSTLASQVSGAGFLGAMASLNFPLAIFSSVIRLFAGKPSLEAQRTLAQTLIKKISGDRKGLHIVYVIDDLDRLEPDEALEVIRLIKAVANFPNITYLISYDREVLSHAIESSAEVEDGAAYLEKIIQFGLKVPAPGPFRIRRFLRNKLELAYSDQADWKSLRAGAVLDTWAGRLLKTPRDVVRVFEAVRLKWERLRSFNADLLDLVWIEMIKEKASKGDSNLYSWVLNYVSSLEAIAIGGQVSQRTRSQEELSVILEKLGWKPPAEGEHAELDFHHLDALLAGVTSSYVPSTRNHAFDDRLWVFQFQDRTFEKYREERRFTSPWHWGLYSGFRQSDNALPDAVWERLHSLAHGMSSDLTRTIQTVLEVSELNADRDTIGDQLLELVINDVSQSAPNVGEFWWRVIMDVADSIYERSASSGFGLKKSAGFQIEKLTEAVLGKLTVNDRRKLLMDVYKNAQSLWALGEVYRDQYFEHSEEHPDRNEPYLSESEFSEIQEILLDRLLRMSPSDLLNVPDTWIVPYSILNAAGETRAKEWFAQITLDDEDFINVLESLQTIQSSAQEAPGIPAQYLKNFGDVELTKKRLHAIASNDLEISNQASSILNHWWEGS